jgi:hypothetical protein
MDHEFRRSPSSIIPKVEGTWDVQERDGLCEVGTGQLPCKEEEDEEEKEEEEEEDDDDDDDDDDDILCLFDCHLVYLQVMKLFPHHIYLIMLLFLSYLKYSFYKDSREV